MSGLSELSDFGVGFAYGSFIFILALGPRMVYRAFSAMFDE